MKPRLEISKGRNGRGVRLVVNERYQCPHSLSYMDAAEFLFDLKAFMQSTETGRRCLDNEAARRRAA